jgi:hypothetical protein
MYRYAVGRTLPSTVKYRSHKFVVLQFFHRNGIETVYFASHEYWQFHEGCIGNAGQKGRNSRVAAEAYRKPWKLVGWPMPSWVSIMNSIDISLA